MLEAFDLRSSSPVAGHREDHRAHSSSSEAVCGAA